nr:tyrosine-type recombinase/integrase [Novosphingobium panipatense]
MAALQQRGHKWRAKVRVPASIRGAGEPEHVYRTLTATDRRSATIEADLWEVLLKAEWAERSGRAAAPKAALRSLYEQLRAEAASGVYQLHGGGVLMPELAGIDHELNKLEDATDGRDLSPLEEARVAALQDAAAQLQRKPIAVRPELEPTFAETAADYLAAWKVKPGLRKSNTEQQKKATFALFAGFFGERPMRDVRRQDAASFADQMRRLDPMWARSSSARNLPWLELVRRFGGRDAGLSDATMNRHMTTLQEAWRWAEERGRCEGINPFAGHRRRLKPGVNVHGYLPWESDDLAKLFDPPPARQDVTEIMLVGLFTGLRLDEIASLTFGQIKNAEEVSFIQVADAKTPAGRRQVPIHNKLLWLSRREGPANARVWPGFNPEGPGKKAGADAGREFSRFKSGRGFTDRRQTFHSFRKNVTQIFERNGIPENEAAQILGHERGFTYSRYSPHGITLARKAEIVALIAYPGVVLPEP